MMRKSSAGSGESTGLTSSRDNHLAVIWLQYAWLGGFGEDTHLRMAPRAGNLAVAGSRLWSRLQLSRAKHRGLAGHARIGRLLARLVPFYEYDQAQFFRADDAPEHIGEQRRAAFSAWRNCMRNDLPTPCAQTKEVQARDLRSAVHRRATAYPSNSAGWCGST